MKKSIVILAVMATGIAHAGVIALGSTWSEFAQGSGASVTTSGETSGGFSVNVTRGCYVYQAASLGDFTEEAFGIGDTATITFTTTMDMDAAQAEDLDYRFMLWDELGGGAASARLDWGAPAGETMQAGVGDNAAATGIGSLDESISGTDVPGNVFNASNETATVSLSVSKTGANLFNVSLTWDGIKISDFSLANATADPMDFISAIGFRLVGSAASINAFTISNVSVEVAPTPEGTTFTHQIGGLTAARDLGWDEAATTNAVTPAEFTYSFGAPDYYTDLSNVVITVTALETSDALIAKGAYLAGTNGSPELLDTNEVIVLTVSYEDPDSKLLGLKVDSFGPYWNADTDSEVLFSDGSTVISITNSANGFMKVYDSTALTQLSLANAGTWSMSVYETNNTTFAGMGGFKLEFVADTPFVEEPPPPLMPPHGDVAFTSNWEYLEINATNMAVLGESTDWFSVAMTNTTDKRLIYKMGANAFDVPFQVGETATWSFTAVVGSSMSLNAGDRLLQGSLWDTDINNSTPNGVNFQADWGTPGGTTLSLGKSKVVSPINIGAFSGAKAETTAVPSNALDGLGKSADFVIVVERLTPTNMFVSMSFDDVTVTSGYDMPTDFDSLDELGFRFKQSGDNALIITNMSLVFTSSTFDWYGYWAIDEMGLTEGVNDAEGDDPDDDKMENLLEYALGGNPLVDDAEFFLPTANQGGSYLNLVYRRRLDADNRRLDYNVYSSTDLVLDPITNATVEAGSVAIDTEFESVTNRVSTEVLDSQFMQLDVSLDQ